VLATVLKRRTRCQNRLVAAVIPASWPRHALAVAQLVVIAGAGVAFVAAAAGRAPPSGVLTTYAGVSTGAFAADLAAGIGLLAAASVALVDPVTARLGAFAGLSGAAWFAPDLEGWPGAPSLVRSLGSAAVPLFIAALAFLVVGAPRGLIRPRPLRIVTALGLLLLVGVSASRALVRDPLLDPYCWRDCVDHALLVHADPGLASALDRVWLGATVVLGLLVCAIALDRLARGTPQARRVLTTILVPGALAAATEAVYAFALLRHPSENPRSAEFTALFFARAVAVAALAAGLLLAVAGMRRQRAAVARLADALGEAPLPGRLRDSLAAAFGDPRLEVGYWLREPGRYVDTEGNDIDALTATKERAVTPIVRNGTPVAVVIHDASLLDESFERDLGSAARLAVENERLQAEVRAQLEALQASRARVTERGDNERRRLERNLHDGAQQSLLALSLDLRLARSRAEAEGNRDLIAALSATLEDTQYALDELRELAHGIYPAVLAEAGLTRALETLADLAPVPVHLSAVPDERLAPPVEAALYIAVQETVADADTRGASFVEVEVRNAERYVTLSVVDDGRPRSSTLIHVSDRIGALGGEVVVADQSLRAEVPCG
jgi:signal transduction histidine kinase